jgi:hypothetical protein
MHMSKRIILISFLLIALALMGTVVGIVSLNHAPSRIARNPVPHRGNPVPNDGHSFLYITTGKYIVLTMVRPSDGKQLWQYTTPW